MGDSEETASQKDEQDFSIPGDQDNPAAGGDLSGGTPVGPPQPSAPVQTPANASVAPSSATAAQPKASGRAMFLGNLLKTILTGVQNAQGNPNNAFDRGFMAASPQNQQLRQAQISKAMSEADQAKSQAAITGAKFLMVKHSLQQLPQQDQEKHMETIAKLADNIIKQGGVVEAEGSQQAIDAQAFHSNGTDQRALSHSGRFWSLPTGKMDENGQPVFAMTYVPNKDVLQNDFTWTGTDGEEHTIKAGTPMLGLPKMVEEVQKDVNGDIKEQHKTAAEALGPVTDEKAAGMADFLEGQQKANSILYQKNKTAFDARIPALRAQHERAQADKIAQAKAMATQVKIPGEEEKQAKKDERETVYGFDPKSNELVMTTRADADSRDLQGTYKVTAHDISADRAATRQLNDVQMNTSRYTQAAKDYAEAKLPAATRADDQAKLHTLLDHAGLFDFNIALGKGGHIEIPAVSAIAEALSRETRSAAYAGLSPQAKRLYDGYIRTMAAVPAYQKALTGIGRSNKEMLDLELANIANPSMDLQDIISKQAQFQENIDRAGEGFPRIPGLPTQRDTKRQFERQNVPPDVAKLLHQ